MPESVIPPAKTTLQPQDIVLSEGQRQLLTEQVKRALGPVIESHTERQKWLAKLLHAYKALPEYEVKNFPWPNASNVVIPIVAIVVDTIASRLQRAAFGAPDPVECKVNTKTPFMMTVPPDPNAAAGTPESAERREPLDEKTLRDWCRVYLDQSGGRDRMRTVFNDLPLYGDAFVSPLWIEEKRTYHAYNPDGDVVSQEVPGYSGVRWHVASPDNVLFPAGFEEWDKLPFFAQRLRYSEPEIMQFVKDGVFKQEDVDRLKMKMRDDERRKEEKAAERLHDIPDQIFELFELRGMFEIPSETVGEAPQFEEVVLTYSFEVNLLMRGIYNPYFGKARHFVKIPFLAQPHELIGMGVAEMALPFQEEASTSHNQVIDAATAGNAGITVLSDRCNVQPNEEIHPGKTIITEGDPRTDVHIVHLSEPSATLGQVEERAFFMCEKRTGVSVYNLGMESPVVGSRATATGTTALINEGNVRFWVSIDDMRHALEELLYLTIQQEQQMRPEGYYFERGRYIQFPQGDPRQTIALTLKLSSETVNRDMEVQQMQMLMQVCNDYYMRLSQAMMLISNPQFPPEAKMMAIQVMTASGILVKKFVERFNIEDLDGVVPTILKVLQNMAGMMQSQGGMGGPQPNGGPAPSPGGAPPVGPGQVM